MGNTGLGDANARLKVYIANRPAFADFQQLHRIHPLSSGDIGAIGKQCGNGWRKVFNVYAKLVFASRALSKVCKVSGASWQQYRDNMLLQTNSHTALLFSPPDLEQAQPEHILHLVMGKQYANTLDLPDDLDWIDQHFAISRQARLIVCPYFDYRQLSNQKIIYLCSLIEGLTGAGEVSISGGGTLLSK